MRTRAHLLSLAALLSVAISPTFAGAQPPLGNADTARQLFNEAEDARLAKDFTTCVSKARRAFELFQNAQILGVLGSCEYELGEFVEAAKHLSAYISDASNQVEPWMTEAHNKTKARVAEVEVTCNAPAAKVVVDGATVGPAPALVFLLPGEHTIQASKEGYGEETQRKTLLAGTKITIAITLSPSGVVGPGPAASDPLPMWPAIVGFSVAGAGILLGAGMSIASSVRSGDVSDVAQACAPGAFPRCAAEGQPVLDEADTFANVGIAGFVVGGAALLFAIPYAVAAGSESSSTVGFVPILSPDFAGGTIRARF